MKPRVIIIGLLTCLLGLGVIVSYGNHVSARDRHQIETIISSDASFKNVHVKRMGNGLLLDGIVATKADLNVLFQKVNQVKRGRVVSKVTVQSAQTAN
jgi:hypothetical protein